MDNQTIVSKRLDMIENKVQHLEKEVSSMHNKIDDIPAKLSAMISIPNIQSRVQGEKIQKFRHCYESPITISFILSFLTAIVFFSYYVGKHFLI